MLHFNTWKQGRDFTLPRDYIGVFPVINLLTGARNLSKAFGRSWPNSLNFRILAKCIKIGRQPFRTFLFQEVFVKDEFKKCTRKSPKWQKNTYIFHKASNKTWKILSLLLINMQWTNISPQSSEEINWNKSTNHFLVFNFRDDSCSSG